MEVENFVVIMNRYAPSKEEILKKRPLNEGIVEEIIEDFTFIYTPINKTFSNKIEELYACTNIKNKNIGQIRMCGFNNIEESAKLIEFAWYYESSPILFKIDSKDFFCLDFFQNESYVKCANNDNKFLSGLALYGKIWLNYTFRNISIISEDLKKIEEFDNIAPYNNIFLNLLNPLYIHNNEKKWEKH